ncbi:helix-turn-helix transcriptional regulator [Enterococcus hulanensis]|uniref:helix-turn-helix transcriptional regulator n=1 Tax=Enterococcus hulanensis TaxID=2559929 RepID=UPI001A8E2311|nr:helix-turn-helix transcriptional regulator [Enterococcus hulanensis]MBO0456618.1 helix-turn-helix transcriptional regulator [Enterococcus hulanensis]
MLSGEKIQMMRTEHDLSQKELAEKLGVSRQAIAKWETNRGIPDIENLKRIAQLFEVSIDYLVSEEESIQEHVMKLPIDLEQYPIPKGNALKEDQVVLEKFPDAGAIRELYRRRKMTTKENMVDFLLFPGIQEVQDHWRDASKYYLIERNSCHFLVNVTENAVLTRRLAIDVSGKSFELAGDKFIKTRRKLK